MSVDNDLIKIKIIKKKGEGFGFDTRSVYWYNKHDNTQRPILFIQPGPTNIML